MRKEEEKYIVRQIKEKRWMDRKQKMKSNWGIK